MELSGRALVTLVIILALLAVVLIALWGMKNAFLG